MFGSCIAALLFIGLAVAVNAVIAPHLTPPGVHPISTFAALTACEALLFRVLTRSGGNRL